MLSYSEAFVSGHFYLEAVIHNKSITLYGPKYIKFANDYRKPFKEVFLARRDFDMFVSIVAFRSFNGYSEADIAYLMNQFNMWYFKFDRESKPLKPEYIDRKAGIKDSFADNSLIQSLLNTVKYCEKHYLK